MLTDDALLGVFSSGKIEDTSKDDWRFDVGNIPAPNTFLWGK
ncbi:MAG: hypothetical protein V2B19_04230 [Pseudomonadota bacterium]